MKTKAIIGLFAIVAIILLVVMCTGREKCDCKDCNGGEPCKCELKGCKCEDKTKPDSAINLTIYWDLSDRLVRDLTPSQGERDSAVIMYLANKVKEDAIKHRILPSKNRIKVFFYPAPTLPSVAMCAENLELDLSKIPAPEKKYALNDLDKKFSNSISSIYRSSISAHNWTGSDIWTFFNKQIDTFCIIPGCRNILIILTDGYIYSAPGKLADGKGGYNYILPQTLAHPNSYLINGRSGKPLNDLEVLILEVNAYNPNDAPRMEKIMLDWLNTMGVKKSYVGYTGLPSDTRLIIDNILGL